MIFSKLNGTDGLESYPAAIRRALEFLRTADLWRGRRCLPT